jgi:hypothetical protein
MRRSPGFASKDDFIPSKDDFLQKGASRPSRGIPSDRQRFPRLQLRGSAGFAPASLSLPSGKGAHPVGFKEQELLVQGIYEGSHRKSTPLPKR